MLSRELDDSGIFKSEKYAYAEGTLGGIFPGGGNTGHIFLKDEALNEIYMITLSGQMEILHYIVQSLSCSYTVGERSKVRIEPFTDKGKDRVKIYLDGRELNWARTAVRRHLGRISEPLTEEELSKVAIDMQRINARLRI